MNASLRPIAWTCRALCAGLVAMPWLSAQAQDTPQRVEITGSSIKRTDAETALPVQVMTREDIARTGATTLLAGDLGCLMNMAGRLQRLGHPVMVRHVAEVLADMGEIAPIGERR